MKVFANRQRLAAISMAMALGLIVVGLWPFAFLPANQVSWLGDRPGLQFRPDSIVCDSEPLPDGTVAASTNHSATFAVELWVEAELEPSDNVYHLVTIDNGQLPSGFVLCQWKSALLLRIPDKHNPRGFREVGLSGALGMQEPHFIVLAGSSAGTAFYLDGKLAGQHPRFVLPAGNLRGRLLLGNAADGKHAWSGRMFGLAIFNRALTEAEIAAHHAAWTNQEASLLSTEPGLTALYLFDEKTGPLANDRSTNRHRLGLPTFYRVPHRIVLGYDPIGRAEFDDILINIFGFVPLGFLAYRHRHLIAPRCWLRNALLAVFIGIALSLAIELTQVWLPNRVSSVTDLVCNSAGTLWGVMVALIIRVATKRR